jgi:hypothetical protein
MCNIARSLIILCLVLHLSINGSAAPSGALGFYASGTVKSYTRDRQGSLNLHSEADINAIVARDAYRINTHYRARVGGGPSSTQIANDGKNFYQSIEWDPSLLKRFHEGGLHDNTHIVTIKDPDAMPIGLTLPEFIGWCTFAFHVSTNELSFIPNIFQDLSSETVFATNVARCKTFGIPSSLDVTRVSEKSLNSELKILPIGAKFRVLSFTNCGPHILPVRIKIEVYSGGANLLINRIIDEAELVILNWETKKLEDTEFLPVLPKNSTLVDQRSRTNGDNIYEFGDIGWSFLGSTSKN